MEIQFLSSLYIIIDKHKEGLHFGKKKAVCLLIEMLVCSGDEAAARFWLGLYTSNKFKYRRWEYYTISILRKSASNFSPQPYMLCS